jgi:hypothetical protein
MDELLAWGEATGDPERGDGCVPRDKEIMTMRDERGLNRR